jgi:hypothetical protein
MLLWGKCQGSGKVPYQVSVDLNGPAFRCTCPSRKFPCKHGVALMLMWAANDGSIADVQEVAAFAEEWAAERKDKSTKAIAKAEKLASGEGVADPEAKAKREAKRLSSMDEGIADLGLFLCDAMRQGTAAARAQPYSFWDHTAARLVDAQAPGLAERVRNLPTLAAHPDWADRLLRELARLLFITAAWARRQELHEDQVAELRRVVGWARQSDEVIASGTVEDDWTICGRTQEVHGSLATQRTWLWTRSTGEWSVQVDTAAGNLGFAAGHGVGMILSGSAALYPGLAPRRLLPVAWEAMGAANALPAAEPIADAMERFSAVLVTNPWVGPIPATLQQVEIMGNQGGFQLSDEQGNAVKLSPSFQPWMIVALRGLRATDVFGEWTESGFMPMAISHEGGVVTV